MANHPCVLNFGALWVLASFHKRPVLLLIGVYISGHDDHHDHHGILVCLVVLDALVLVVRLLVIVLLSPRPTRFNAPRDCNADPPPRHPCPITSCVDVGQATNGQETSSAAWAFLYMSSSRCGAVSAGVSDAGRCPMDVEGVVLRLDTGLWKRRQIAHAGLSNQAPVR